MSEKQTKPIDGEVAFRHFVYMLEQISKRCYGYSQAEEARIAALEKQSWNSVLFPQDLPAVVQDYAAHLEPSEPGESR